MLSKQIIINASASETRIALLERDELADLYIERHHKQNILGNVYLGKIIRVLPGMQSAFVDIGIGQAGFLYAKDVVAAETEIAELADEGDNPYPANRQPIEKVLKAGQQILVQIVKESFGSKGPRLTMGVAVPGRYLVLLPSSSRIGVSRKIENDKERKRLRETVSEIRENDLGIIVRTAAENLDRSYLERDLKYLGEVWNAISVRKSRARSPGLLHMDFSIISRIARDIYTDDVEKIIVDDESCYEELTTFFRKIDHQTPGKIELYRGDIPVFDVYGIEQDIDLFLQAKVDLPIGGFVVVDETEALTTFDVNTGKYVGRKSADETILQTNLESIRVIVNQIRVRNIGGIIVIDFIDMNSVSDRENVYKSLLQHLKLDKARTSVLKISDFGLVQMTRKRTRESLEKTLTTPCPLCAGRGRCKSEATMAYDVLRAVRRTHARTQAKKMVLKVRGDVYRFILAEEKKHLEQLQTELRVSIELSSLPFHDPAWEKDFFTLTAQ